ncbi:cyclic nucleotide-binding domain-containing protein [Silvanigrella sp.]|jgi:CRP-like cAMP-binding protein|uniref:cyclic nucleotide-binding domain-containing protein n=1 Tax=Silvanigrella sp. TaxID=2024976 RepID=UPI0037CB2FBA
MIESFKDISLFKDLNDNQLERLQEICYELKLNIGEIFIHEGRLEQRFFIIIDGSVEIIKKNGDRFYPLAKLSKGEIVGEMVLFENAARSASAKAIEPSTVLCFDLEKIKNDPNYLDIYAKFTSFFGEKISKRLRYTNEVTVEVLKERLAIGNFAVNIIAITTLYAISLQMLQKLKSYMSNSTLVTIIVLIMFCYFIISMMLKSGYPLKTFGITIENWRKLVIESILYTIPLLVIIMLLKYIVITFNPKLHHLPLFDPMSIFKTSADISLKVYFAALFGYIIFVPIQELIVRSGIQSALQKFLTGSKTKTMWSSIILSNILFAGGHSHISAGFALSVFIPGIFWGWLFAKQNSLIGVSVSHILIGVWGAFIVGFENIF